MVCARLWLLKSSSSSSPAWSDSLGCTPRTYLEQTATTIWCHSLQVAVRCHTQDSSFSLTILSRSVSGLSTTRRSAATDAPSAPV
ncbi:hypothetical protein BD324DRAFT_627800 [Kockovaella imperatae]|uniref:Uncharacterized protein n=1 Tax=Kockovaella imperatae TaxID=4999 RepID=A0A1Y1UHI9_9TREE|nr:hypothetical protein BD324DRAFT_627800 [Kockovaella imperatae]ORX36944.1 hypothetical protein BD324DRAFT_627800 [Kockovaella imperatae]